MVVGCEYLRHRRTLDAQDPKQDQLFFAKVQEMKAPSVSGP